jgi:hypothetical protein
MASPDLLLLATRISTWVAESIPESIHTSIMVEKPDAYGSVSNKEDACSHQGIGRAGSRRWNSRRTTS